MAKNPKKIGFNGRPFCQEGMRGLSRHTLELILGLRALHPELEFYVYSYGAVSTFYKQALPFVHFRERNVRLKLLWDLFWLGHDVRSDKLDIFHSTNNVGVPWVADLPIFVTIHDHFSHVARYPWGRTPSSWWASLNYRIELCLLRRVAGFFTVSQSAKVEIIHRLNIPDNKIVVTYNGSSLPITTSPDVVEDYYLYVGGLEERKNVGVMLDGFRQFSRQSKAQAKLKIVGKLAGAPTQVINQIMGSPELFSIIESTTDNELAGLYQNARALIFPSLEEGFGLPLVEALGLGCPAVVSEIPVFREIAQDAALYFSPTSASDLSSCLERLAIDTSLRDQLIHRGRQLAARFTWKNMAADVYARYLEVLR